MDIAVLNMLSVFIMQRLVIIAVECKYRKKHDIEQDLQRDVDLKFPMN